jgi:cellulose synthase/poly-beta-1,6-N-acetylglucosamine synthase-like glycosyltransferase
VDFLPGNQDEHSQRIFQADNNCLMQFLYTGTAVLLMIYALLIFYYHRIWNSVPAAECAGPDSGKNENFLPTVPVTVIIPARNEADRIRPCLDALLVQTYPKSHTEVIVVDDFSTDQTGVLVRDHPLGCRLINLADHVSGELNSYKKKAIETGIKFSTGELIICTDADCTMGPDWIRVLVEFHQRENLQFIAAPVKIVPDGSGLSIFQALDFISLQGITGAAVYKKLYPMCNGANLAYTRKAFDSVGGFSGIDHIASGDDMLLMKKIQEKYPHQTGYLKDSRAIISTGPAENIRAFLNQRIRWASKISHYRHGSTFITLALVYLVNAGLLILFFFSLIYGQWRWLLVLLVFKTISEYFFVSRVARFFRQQSFMKYFPLCQPLHILYTVVAGGFGSFGKYYWKARKVR